MSILEINNLKFSYGDKNLYNNLSLRLEAKEHVGLIGANGTGKSTLMNLINRKMDPDEGTIVWENHIEYSYLDQYLKVKEDITIRDYLLKVYDELFLLEKQMNDLYQSLEHEDESKYDKILNRAYYIQNMLEEKGFYLIKSNISNVMNGLGIQYDDDWLLKNLSGGQRAKVFLAKMLLEEKDVLLLDEPTNFLDVIHVDWLVKYLNAYPKAFIVISHNTEFINQISNVIFDLNNKTIMRYKGDYNAYLMQKQMKDELYQKEFESQQKLIKKTEDFINKNIVRASTTKRAQSRQKMLDKIVVMEKPVTQKKVKFDFPFSTSFNMEAVSAQNLEIGYTHTILPKIKLKVRFGEKVVIIGKNGVGKTTFLKTLLGIISPISGDFKLNPLNKVIYFSQDFLLPQELTAVAFIKEDYPLMEDKIVRDLLGRYGLVGDLAMKSMDKLSGGELTKARFAKLSLEKSNLLILDEPTNHLDKNAKEALFKAISTYPGTVLIVSHEEDFYKKLKMKELKFQ